MTWRVAQEAQEKEILLDTRALTFPTVSTYEYVTGKRMKILTINNQSLCSVDSFNSVGMQLKKCNLEFKSWIFMAKAASSMKKNLSPANCI